MSTLAELAQEVEDRGYNYVKSPRIKSFLNRAYRQLCARKKWPFLEADEEGPAPVEFTDLRYVLYAKDSSTDRPLRGVRKRWLERNYADLTETGAPAYFYLDGGTLKTYPVSTNPLVVRYVRRPAVLTDEDEPLVPDEWQYLLVDRAIVDCLKDDDEYQEARELKGEVEEGIAEMIHALLHPQHSDAPYIERTGSPGDYL